MATCSASDHDICVERNKYIVAFILHPLQHERWKRNLLRIIALLRPAPIVHVSSVLFVFVIVMYYLCSKKVSTHFSLFFYLSSSFTGCCLHSFTGLSWHLDAKCCLAAERCRNQLGARHKILSQAIAPPPRPPP
jgi:hypothetical protein